MKRLFATIALLTAALSAHARPTMAPELHLRLIEEQRAKLESFPCCTEISGLRSEQVLGMEFVEHDLGGADMPHVAYEGERVPAVVLRLPPHEGAMVIEFATLARSAPGAVNLAKTLFVRPDVLVTDADGNVVESHRDPMLCWNDLPQHTSASARVSIEHSEAVYVILVPSIRQPIQAVDTRTLAFTPAPGAAVGTAAILGALADSRWLHAKTMHMGLTGILAVHILADNAMPLGHCVDQKP